VASLLLASGASLALLILPTYEGQSCETMLNGSASATRCLETHTTLIDENGSWHALILLMLPVVIAALGLGRSRATRSALALMLGSFALITGFSIGNVYLPAVVAAIVAARRTPRARASRQASLSAP